MLQLIKERWKEPDIDETYRELMWDDMADEYRERSIPTFESDQFLQLLEKQGGLSKNYRALDIGCGTGRYAIALAPRLSNITGIDLSSKMIAYGKEAVKQRGIPNVTLYNESWNHIDRKTLQEGPKYDLVIAHMTPAIESYDSFTKMLEAGRRYFAFCKPVRRKNVILEEISKLTGEVKKDASGEDQIPYLFHTLWLLGAEPSIYYEKQIWKTDRTIEEEKSRILNRMRSRRMVEEEEEKEITSYLTSIEQEGRIHEETETTIVTFLWEKNGGYDF